MQYLNKTCKMFIAKNIGGELKNMNFLKAKITSPLIYISSGQFVSENSWIHDKRIIDSFEIIVGIKGITYIQQDEDKFEIHPGDVLLLLPGHIHQGYSNSNGNCSFYWLHFYCKDNNHAILDKKEAYFEISTLKSNSYFSKLSENILIPIFSKLENPERIFIQINQLLHIANSKYITPFATDYLLTLILIELSQQAINTIYKIIDIDNINSRNNNLFINILEWIRINIHEDISINEISGKFGYNKDYLSRIFKKHLGVGIKKFINGCKIAKAKELLCQSENSIKEIAYHIGFKDEKYFMKLFKEYESLTPSQYRNAYYRTFINNK